MTIAIKVELKEDWGGNCPEVLVMARTLRGSDDYPVARLTPQEPIAHVVITRDQDLYFKPGSYAVEVMNGRARHEGYIVPTPGAPPRNVSSEDSAK